MPSIEEIVKGLKAKGLTAIEIQKHLRDNNMIVPWVEVKRIFIKV